MTQPTEKQTRAQKRADEKTRLEAAFQRLLAQNPENNQLESEELREMLEEVGHVPVTQDNVALEAELSRKLITGSSCAFPELAERIKAVRSTHGVKPSTRAQLDGLHSDLAEARQLNVVMRSKMAEAIAKADRAETELGRERALTVRLRQQVAKGGR